MLDPAELIDYHGFDKDELMAWARKRAEELLENVSDEDVAEMLSGMDFDPAPRAAPDDEESVTRPVSVREEAAPVQEEPVAAEEAEEDLDDIEELDLEEVEELDDEALELIEEEGEEGDEAPAGNYEDVPVRSGQTDVHAAVNEPIADDDVDDSLLGDDGEIDDELEGDDSIPIDLDDF